MDDGQQAVLVPVNDPRALGLAVATLLSDRESRDRLARRGRERVQATPTHRTNDLLELYRSMAATRPALPAGELPRAFAG